MRANHTITYQHTDSLNTKPIEWHTDSLDFSSESQTHKGVKRAAEKAVRQYGSGSYKRIMTIDGNAW